MKMAAIRERLHSIAERVGHHGMTEIATELHFLAEETRRRRYIRKKSKHHPSKRISPAMKRWIKTLRREGLPYEDIARITGVFNHGRLSEICSGKRV